MEPEVFSVVNISDDTVLVKRTNAHSGWRLLTKVKYGAAMLAV
jgi:hypothetical protein